MHAERLHAIQEIHNNNLDEFWFQAGFLVPFFPLARTKIRSAIYVFRWNTWYSLDMYAANGPFQTLFLNGKWHTWDFGISKLTKCAIEWIEYIHKIKIFFVIFLCGNSMIRVNIPSDWLFLSKEGPSRHFIFNDFIAF